MNIADIITIDAQIQAGTPVFSGTRVPIESLFWHLEDGITINEFLLDFPSVQKVQAVALLELAQKTITSPRFTQFIHEIAA